VKHRESASPERWTWQIGIRLCGRTERRAGSPAAPCRVAVLTLLGIVVAMTWLTQCAAAALDLTSLVPKSDAVADWRMQGKPATYTRANLYDYIDGGADLYLGYGFTRAVVADYLGPGGAKITVELYDMGSSYDAFGIFAREQAKVSPSIGQGASYAGGLLTFWKDRIFARIFADRETEATRAAVLRMGKLASTAVRSKGARPPLIALLPQPGIAGRSMRYMHTDAALNSVLYLPGNPLRLGAKTNVAYAEYPAPTGAPGKLVIAEYPAARDAAGAFAGLAKLHGTSLSRGRAQYAAKTERFKWVGGALRGRYVIVVSNAADEATVRRLMEATRNRVGKA